MVRAETGEEYRFWVVDNVRQQEDLINCGVYVIMVMYSLATSSDFCTDAHNVNLHRLYIAHWITSGRLGSRRVEDSLEQDDQDLFGEKILFSEKKPPALVSSTPLVASTPAAPSASLFASTPSTP